MKKILGGLSILIVFLILAGCTFSGWPTYTNAAYGFQLQYPPGGSIVSGATDTSIRIELPITAGTNLSEKYLDIDVEDGALTCVSPLAAGFAPGIITPVSLTINGLSWTRENAGEGAAGSLYEWTAYSTVSGSVCVILTFVLHSHNPQIYATPPPTFNSAAESGVFILIVDTFKWLGAGSAAVTPTVVTCTTASLHAPTLLMPANGAVISDLDPTLTWQYPDACVPEGYRVDLSVDLTFADTSLSGGTGNPSTSWGPAHPLADCTLYFWKVAPINGTTLGPASEVFTFRTNASGTCTPEATLTPTVVPSFTPAVIPSPTLGNTSSPSPLIFTPRVSPLEFNYQVQTDLRVCILKSPQVDISVAVSNPAMVHGVVLFFRLKNKGNGEETAWNNGLNMDPQGNGNFDKSLSANQIPNLSAISAGKDSAWLEYQFAATDLQGNTIGRSPVYSNVSLSPCN